VAVTARAQHPPVVTVNCYSKTTAYPWWVWMGDVWLKKRFLAKNPKSFLNEWVISERVWKYGISIYGTLKTTCY